MYTIEKLNRREFLIKKSLIEVEVNGMQARVVERKRVFKNEFTYGRPYVSLSDVEKDLLRKGVGTDLTGGLWRWSLSYRVQWKAVGSRGWTELETPFKTIGAASKTVHKLVQASDHVRISVAQ